LFTVEAQVTHSRIEASGLSRASRKMGRASKQAALQSKRVTCDESVVYVTSTLQAVMFQGRIQIAASVQLCK
jgi:hypothetical protein